MSDLLSSASLLLAVLGVLYGLWNPEIIKALDTKVSNFYEDNKHPYTQVLLVYKSRALPLTIAAIGISIIFLPDAIMSVSTTFQNFLLRGLGYIKDYCAVHTAFCFVEVMSIFIAIHLINYSAKLWQLCNQLSKQN